MTDVIKTISKTGTPDYSSPALWEADAAVLYGDDLVTNTVRYIGEIQEPTDNYTSASNLLTMSGSITNSLYYKWLRTANVASFKDNVNVNTNPLDYNEANGCSLSSSASITNGTVDILEDYGKITGIQIRNNSPIYEGWAVRVNAVGAIVEKCINISEGSTQSVPYRCSGVSYIRNCLNIQGESGAARIASLSSGSVSYNNIWVTPSDLTPATVAFVNTYGAPTHVNDAVFGVSDFYSGTAPTCDTCYSDDATPPTGVTTTTYDTTIGSGFYSILNASRDFRVKDTSAFNDTGTFSALLSPEDIKDLPWEFGNTDVGCWKILAAIISGNGTVFDNDAVVAFGIANGFGNQYNDILLNWLRSNYSTTTSTLGDLIARWIRDNGKDLP